jgi:hypothetical protein
MNQFRKQKNGILRIDDSTVLLMGDIHVPAEDTTFTQFEKNHFEDYTSSDYSHDDFNWKGGVDGN